MKKKLRVITLIILLTMIVVSWGLTIFYTIRNHQDYSASVEFRGHRYVLFHADGANATTHDPDCPCHKKEGNEP